MGEIKDLRKELSNYRLQAEKAQHQLKLLAAQSAPVSASVATAATAVILSEMKGENGGTDNTASLSVPSVRTPLTRRSAAAAVSGSGPAVSVVKDTVKDKENLGVSSRNTANTDNQLTDSAAKPGSVLKGTYYK